MALMVMDVTWQILTRFFTDSPSSWSEEVARFLLIWIGLLGAAWAYRKRAHLGLSYLVEKCSKTSQQKLAIFSYLMAILFAALVMIYGGMKLVLLTLELNQMSASLGIKIGYVYMVIPASGVLISLYAFDFIRTGMSGEHYTHPHLQDDNQSEEG